MIARLDKGAETRGPLLQLGKYLSGKFGAFFSRCKFQLRRESFNSLKINVFEQNDKVHR